MYTGKKSKSVSNQGNNAKNKEHIEKSLCNDLEGNISLFKELFKNDDTLILRRFENQQNSDIKCCILFIDGMINTAIINEDVIKPIVVSHWTQPQSNMMDHVMYRILVSDNVEKTSAVYKVLEAIVIGNTVLFLENSAEALIINSKGWKTRSIEEPEGEKVIRGPREGFTESLLMNLSLVRRRLPTHDLKFKFRSLGVKSPTKICLCYIEGIANEKILNEVNQRLDKIDIDTIIGSSVIQELIKDSPFTPFKTVGNTERPDVIAAKLMEGRFAIIVDGTPVALTLPHLFIEYFQSNEDYYINFYYAGLNRLLRISSFILTISLPAVFVAMTAFHQETIPTPLIKSISAARQDIPFPIFVETLSLLIVFEILRETGTRMPTQMGQALSIVGALVLGQAAVEARFVSAPVVIVVALTGITGLAIPRLKGATVMIRMILLFLASLIGLYGYVFGLTGLLIHLFELRTFGIPFMLSFMNYRAEDIEDTVIRAPWFYMKYRPKFISVNHRLRNASGGKKR